MILRDALMSKLNLALSNKVSVLKISAACELLHDGNSPDLKIEPFALFFLECPIPLRLEHLVWKSLEILKLGKLLISFLEKLIYGQML